VCAWRCGDLDDAYGPSSLHLASRCRRGTLFLNIPSVKQKIVKSETYLGPESVVCRIIVDSYTNIC
jgi:hypothetical protein